MNVWLPTWLAEVSDDELVTFVRQQIELCRLRDEAEANDLIRRKRWWDIYHSLSFWQRLKVRLGYLKF